MESPGVRSRSRSETESLGIGVIRNWSRSESTGAVRCNVLVIRHFISFEGRLRTTLTRTDSGRLQPTPTNSNQLQPTPTDSERLRTTPTPNASGLLRGILDNSKRLRIMLAGTTFRIRFQNYWSRIGVDSGFLPTLPITAPNIINVRSVNGNRWDAGSWWIQSGQHFYS